MRQGRSTTDRAVLIGRWARLAPATIPRQSIVRAAADLEPACPQSDNRRKCGLAPLVFRRGPKYVPRVTPERSDSALGRTRQHDALSLTTACCAADTFGAARSAAWVPWRVLRAPAGRSPT